MEFENNSIAYTGKRSPAFGRAFSLMLAVILITAMMLGAVVHPGLSQVQAPSIPGLTWQLETVDGPRYFTNMTDRSVAYKTVDMPCAAYGGDGLYYACYNKTTDEWDVTVLDSSPDVGQFAALTYLTRVPSGVIDTYISYFDNANGKLKLAYTFMGAWQPLVTVPDPGFGTTAPIPGMPGDPLDAPQAPSVEAEPVRPDAGMRQFQAPAVSIMAETEPAFPIKTNKGYGKFTSIAANQKGIYISFYDDRDNITNATTQKCTDAGIICERNLKVASWDGVTWDFDLIHDYSDQGKVGLWTSLKVDFTGNLHLAYMNEKYDELWYAFRGTSWRDPVRVDGGYPSQVGPMCSLALDDTKVIGEKGIPYISYLDDDRRNLRVARLIDLPSNRWIIDTVDSGDNVGWYTSIAVGSDNKVYISYYYADTADLKYAKGKVGGDWAIQTAYKGGGMVGLFTSIGLGVDEKPGILHLNTTKAQLLFTRYKTSTTWDTDVVDSGGDVGYATSIKIAPSGTPHIGYLDATMGNLKYASRFPDITTLDPNDMIWGSYHPVYGPHMGIYNDLDLFDESPRVAAYDSDKGNLVYGENPWLFEFIQKTDDVGQHVSMAIDSSDLPHFSFYDATNTNLVYATWNLLTKDWYTYTVDWINDVGQYTSIALSTDDRPFISYYDVTNQNLKIAYVTPGLFWKVETVDGGPDDVGMFSSIALDNLGRPHISYYAETSDTDEYYRNPRYVYWNGSDWVIDTNFHDDDPNKTDEQGIYTSLVINQVDNSRHVCFYNKTLGALRYARYNGAWAYDTVDNVGDTGYSCSIDLNDGKPVITYYDNTGGDLQIAYDNTIVWPTMPFLLYLPIIE